MRSTGEVPTSKARRTTHRSTSGNKLDAVRDSNGRFENLQTFERAHPVPGRQDDEVVIPLLGEEVAVTKQLMETGRVTVTRVTREQSALIAEPLAQETVEITRQQIGRQVETMPAVRQEGDTVVIPIVEERLVTERRLFLKEEVRVRRLRASKTHQESVTLRHHEVVVNAIPAPTPPAEPGQAPDENSVASDVLHTHNQKERQDELPDDLRGIR